MSGVLTGLCLYISKSIMEWAILVYSLWLDNSSLIFLTTPLLSSRTNVWWKVAAKIWQYWLRSEVENWLSGVVRLERGSRWQAGRLRRWWSCWWRRRFLSFRHIRCIPIRRLTTSQTTKTWYEMTRNFAFLQY